MKYLLLITILTFLCMPNIAWADVVIENENNNSVVNNFSVEANSGNNSSKNSEDGTAEANIKTYTEINGETVIDKKYHVSGTSSVSVEIENIVNDQISSTEEIIKIDGTEIQETKELEEAINSEREVKKIEDSSEDYSENKIITNTKPIATGIESTVVESQEIAKNSTFEASVNDEIDETDNENEEQVVEKKSIWEHIVYFFKKIFDIF